MLLGARIIYFSFVISFKSSTFGSQSACERLGSACTLFRIVGAPRALDLRSGPAPLVDTPLNIHEHGRRLPHGEVGLEILYIEQSLFEFSVELSLSGVTVGHIATDGDTVGIRSYSRIQVSTNVVAHYNI
jgi:hypothetical protein